MCETLSCATATRFVNSVNSSLANVNIGGRHLETMRFILANIFIASVKLLKSRINRYLICFALISGSLKAL